LNPASKGEAFNSFDFNFIPGPLRSEVGHLIIRADLADADGEADVLNTPMDSTPPGGVCNGGFDVEGSDGSRDPQSDAAQAADTYHVGLIDVAKLRRKQVAPPAEK
jgi:hypothetical protein